MNKSVIYKKVVDSVAEYGEDKVNMVLNQSKIRVAWAMSSTEEYIKLITNALYQIINKIKQEYKLGRKKYVFHKAIVSGNGDIIVIYKHKQNKNIKLFRADMFFADEIKELESEDTLEIEGLRVDLLKDDYLSRKFIILNGDGESEEDPLELFLIWNNNLIGGNQNQYVILN